MTRLRLFAPLYLLHSETQCYQCDRVSPVAAMAVERFEEISDGGGDAIEDFAGETAIISDVSDLSPELLAAIREFHPQYEKRYSRTAECEYFMNTCIHCGAHFGDFYMHCEPDGAFFPMEEDSLRAIRIRRLKLEGPMEITGGYGVGRGNEIMAKGQRVA